MTPSENRDIPTLAQSSPKGTKSDTNEVPGEESLQRNFTAALPQVNPPLIVDAPSAPSVTSVGPFAAHPEIRSPKLSTGVLPYQAPRLPPLLFPGRPLLPPAELFPLANTCPLDVVTVRRYLPPPIHQLLRDPSSCKIQQYEEKLHIRVRVPER